MYCRGYYAYAVRILNSMFYNCLEAVMFSFFGCSEILDIFQPTAWLCWNCRYSVTSFSHVTLLYVLINSVWRNCCVSTWDTVHTLGKPT